MKLTTRNSLSTTCSGQ